MKLKKLCNPFTGHELNVAEFEDGSFVFDKAYDHETIAVGYDKEHDVYMIPASSFKLVYSVSLVEAATMLGVSKMRVSAMCAKGQLQYSKVNGVLRISYDSIIGYRGKRDNARKGYSKELRVNDRDCK